MTDSELEIVLVNEWTNFAGDIDQLIVNVGIYLNDLFHNVER